MIAAVVDANRHWNRRLLASLEAILEPLRNVRATDLPLIEYRVRAVAFYRTVDWHNLTSDDVRARAWPQTALGLLSMHPSGFVREAALRRFTLTADAMPFLLHRLNDWVPQVREAAASAVRKLLASVPPRGWISHLGALARLRKRSRADHAWLENSLRAKFREPTARLDLAAALADDDKDALLWALSVAMDLPEAERPDLLRHAFAHRNPAVRLHAARAARTLAPCPDRDRMLAAMREDRFAPVRLEWLYAQLELPARDCEASLRSMLLDGSGAIRHAARFYLRRANPGVDLRGAYASALSTDERPRLAAAIMGLAESGKAQDADLVMTFADDARVSIAIAAVRAVGALDREGRLAWFELRLLDPRRSVAKAAMRELIPTRSLVPDDRLRALIRSAPHTHSRVFALELLLRRHPFDVTADAILAAVDPNPVIAATGLAYFMGPGAVVSIGPTREQQARVEAVLRQVGDTFPVHRARGIRSAFGLGGGA